MYYLFVHGSRNSALRFYENLNAVAAASLIATPIELGYGCGLSVKTQDYKKAVTVWRKHEYVVTAVYMIDGDRLIKMQ